jgi:histidinol-phosphate aminotransferase
MSASWESLANDHILGIAPYEPGKPVEELARELGVADAIKLASNENPLPPSERVQKAIIDALPHLNRYPDDSGFYLREALGRRHRLGADHVILGNGSDDLIALVARAFVRPGDEVVIPHPSFTVYPMIVQAVGGIRVVVTLRDQRLDLEAMARATNPMTKMVFIANPNNPTATIVTANELEHFMARVPDETVVVVDEAYFEFAQGPDFPDALDYIRQGRKVIVLRTFSKAASLAGLRVGYGLAEADCVSLLNRIRTPFNVNALAQVAALAAIEDEAHILECRQMIEAGRTYLCDEFTALGVRYTPSRANFILVDVGRNAHDLYRRLLKNGVIVRPMMSFGMESALRISIGTPEENRRLIKALRKVLSEGRGEAGRASADAPRGGEGKHV